MKERMNTLKKYVHLELKVINKLPLLLPMLLHNLVLV